MAEYRNILFGYSMVDRDIVLNPEETKVIQEMFRKYAQGLSYNNIAEELTLSQVAYLPDKCKWNKNMVARILQNQQYLGTEKYPPLLTQEQWNSAQKEMKQYNYTISPEIKALKPKIFCGICGKSVERLVTKSGKDRW